MELEIDDAQSRVSERDSVPPARSTSSDGRGRGDADARPWGWRRHRRLPATTPYPLCRTSSLWFHSTTRL